MKCCLVVTQAPFEVEESGWGEFEIQITIYFADPNEKPVFVENRNQF
jgi:YEATS domain-containing protein 4